MANLFAKKSMDVLTAEASATGVGTLKRSLGPFQLTALGIGAVIGAGIFVMAGLGAHYAGPGLMLSFVLSGLGCAFAGLCYAEFAAMIPLAGSAYTYAYATLGELIAWIIGWDLTLEYAMGASTVSSGWSNYFVELLDIFRIKFPLWLAYDHWTALSKAVETCQPSDDGRPAIPPSSPARRSTSRSVGLLKAAPTAAMMAQAHDRACTRPSSSATRSASTFPPFSSLWPSPRCWPSAFRRAAKFNTGIVAIKVAVVLLVLGLGSHYVHPANWGARGTPSRPTDSPASARARPTSSSPTSDSTPSPPPRRRPRTRSAICPSASSLSLVICTVLYIGVAAVLTGMVPWQQVNIEAPIARAFFDRGLAWARDIITLGALAGLTSVMLVMLLGQTRVLYAMANDGLLPRRPFAASPSPLPHALQKYHSSSGLLAGDRRRAHPHRRHRQDGQHRHPAGLRHRLHLHPRPAPHRPGQARPFRTPWVPLVPVLGVLFNGYMMVKLGWVNWTRLIVWLIIGLIVYFIYGRSTAACSAASSPKTPQRRTTNKGAAKAAAIEQCRDGAWQRGLFFLQPRLPSRMWPPWCDRWMNLWFYRECEQ